MTIDFFLSPVKQGPLTASALPQWEPVMQSLLHYTSLWVSRWPRG